MRRALLALIEEKPFEDISVREIAVRGGVTFPTFYRQFASREALLADIARDELSRLASLMSLRADRDNATASARAIFDHVAQRRSLWAALLTTSAAAVMREEFLALTLEWASEQERINPDLPADMVASFVVSAMFEILAWWLRQPDDVPIDTAAGYLERLVLHSVATRGAGH